MSLSFEFDRRLSERLAAVGYPRRGFGLYARVRPDEIVQALWVSIDEVNEGLEIQPALSVFFPKAAKFIDGILQRVYGAAAYDAGPHGIGHPIITRALYAVALELGQSARTVTSYDVRLESEIDAVTSLVCADFCISASKFFGKLDSTIELVSVLEAHPEYGGASAQINALALSRLLVEPTLFKAKLDKVAAKPLNPMTSKFAAELRRTIQETS